MDATQIKPAEFPQVRRGWDPDAVSAHLARVAAAYAELEMRLQVAQAEAKQSRSQAVDQRSDDAIRQVLGLAQRSATTLVADARVEAERLVADEKTQAQQEADTITGKLRDTVEHLTSLRETEEARTSALRRESEQYRLEMIRLHREALAQLEAGAPDVDDDAAPSETSDTSETRVAVGAWR